MENNTNISLKVATIDTLILKLNDDSWYARKEAARELSSRGDEAVESLLKAMDSNNDDVVYWSIQTLGMIATPKAINPLIQKIDISSRTIKANIASALGQNKDSNTIPVLIKLLSDDSWNVCQAAVNSLVYKGEVVIELLVAALKTANYNTSYWITKVFSKIGNKGIDVLKMFLKFKNPNVRILVSEALGDANNVYAINPLIQCLKDEHWSVKENAIESLSKLGPAVVEPLIFFACNDRGDMHKWVEKIFAGIGSQRIAPLIHLLSHEEREVRNLAAIYLGKTKSERAIKPLIESLNDEVWLVRKAAAKALSDLGDIAVDHLLNSLTTEDENVKYWITTILGKIGSRSIDPLVKLLREGSKEMRYFAASALGETHDEKVIPYLIDALQDKLWPIRNNVANALRNLGSIAIIPLIRTLMAQDDNQRFWAKKVILEIGPNELDLFIEMLKNEEDHEMRYYAAYGLSLVGDESCVPALINSLLNDTSEWVRKYSATALAKIKDKRALPALVKILGDPEEEVAYWTAKAFGTMGDIAVSTLQESLKNESEQIRFFSIIALGGIGDEKSIEILIRILGEDERSAEKAVKALSESGDKTIKYLIKALENENVQIRQNASKALSVMGEIAIEPLLKVVDSDNKDVHYWATKAIRDIKKKSI